LEVLAKIPATPERRNNGPDTDNGTDTATDFTDRSARGWRVVSQRAENDLNDRRSGRFS
jgi:hypothetical protein